MFNKDYLKTRFEVINGASVDHFSDYLCRHLIMPAHLFGLGAVDSARHNVLNLWSLFGHELKAPTNVDSSRRARGRGGDNRRLGEHVKRPLWI